MPAVSVVMPVYNAGRFVREAIESILAQTFTDFEFIIVDDGSTDDSLAVVQSFRDERIQFMRNPSNLGIVATLNRGIAKAKGEFICRMDADDISAPDRLQTQVEFLRNNQHIAAVGSCAQLIDNMGTHLGVEQYPRSYHEIKKSIFVHNPFAHGSVMVRRPVLDELGAYDGRFKHNEDYDLWLRIAARYALANIPEALIQRRIHPESITGAKKTELTGYRIRTLVHAVLHYYKNPAKLVYVLRPTAAFILRSLVDVLKR